MYEWKTIKELRYWVHKVLPLVYDDSLSYYELLNKVVVKLNELIENNAKIPDYVAGMIREYISSGAIGKVVNSVIADFMLNVKYPPEGITPAVGDGTADDSASIQACIEYAEANDMALYFPSGKYLANELEATDDISFIGHSRYDTVIVNKGGATKPLLECNCDNVSIIGIGFDGNSEGQVNDLTVIKLNVNSAIIENALIKSGYTLLETSCNSDLQINDVLFNNSGRYGCVFNGNGYVQGDNLAFNGISNVIGESFIQLNNSHSVLEKCKFNGTVATGVAINGNNNYVAVWRGNCTNPVVDNGSNNEYKIYTEKETFNELIVNDNAKFNGTVDFSDADVELFPNVEYTYDTVADMIANLPEKAEYCKVLGYHAINDGGGCNYKISEVSGGNYSILLANGNYATPYTNSPVSVKVFGAVGNGATDDTEAIQKAVEWCEEYGNTLIIPSGVYNSSSVIINSNISIEGTGTIKGYGIRYDTTTSATAEGRNTVKVNNPSLYHINTIITIKSETYSQVMIVTDINGDELTVKKFRYYDDYNREHDGFNRNYPIGSEVHINGVMIVITASAYTIDVDPDENYNTITKLSISGINFDGNRSGFDFSKYAIYDVTLNGCIFIYNADGVLLEKCKTGNCYNNSIAVLGKCNDLIVSECVMHDVLAPTEITDIGVKDVGGGIVLHWDQRKPNDSTKITRNFTIDKCVINNCYNGIFVSSAKVGRVNFCDIRDIKHYGIFSYGGDQGFFAQDISIIGNNIHNNHNSDGDYGTGIGILTSDRIVVANNIMLSNDRGITINYSTIISVTGNELIANTDANIFIGRISGTIKNNYMSSGSGCRATIEIDNESATDITELVFANNLYTGYNNYNAAIRIIKGQNIHCIEENCLIRVLFKIESTVEADKNINAINCWLGRTDGELAFTIAERSKLFEVSNYIGILKLVRSNEKILSKTTSELGAIFSPPKGTTQYDSTTNTLKVYNGSAWVNV